MVHLRPVVHDHTERQPLPRVRAEARLDVSLLLPQPQFSTIVVGIPQPRRFQRLLIAFVAPFVFALSALVSQFSLAVHLQLARQLHDDLARLAIGGDERVHHAAQLVHADVDRRVGYAPPALGFAKFVRVARRVAADNRLRQDLAVVRQLASGVGVSEVGMTVVAGGLGGVRVHFAALQVGNHLANRLLAKVAVPARRRDAGDRFGLVGVQTPIRPSLVRDRVRVFGVKKESGDFIALVEWERRPAPAEQFGLAELGGGFVARYLGAPAGG